MVAKMAQSANPSKPLYVERYTKGGYSLSMHAQEGAVFEKIASRRWNIVVLQEQSGASVWDLEGYSKMVSLYKSKAEKIGAKVILYEGWGRIDTQFESYNYQDWILANEYAADQNGVAIAPVGFAWHKMMSQTSRIKMYKKDGNHATLAGSYLAAATIYSSIFNRPSFGLWGPAGLKENKKALQAMSWIAVSAQSTKYRFRPSN